MNWLTPCTQVDIPSVDVVAIDQRGIAEPNEAPLEIRDSGSPLVAVEGRLQVFPTYQRLAIPAYPDPMRLRADLVGRLERAERRLPARFRLVVLDGWRPRIFQRHLIDFYEGAAAGYVAAVDGPAVPPHTTGGAVDLTLSYLGVNLGLGTDFDDFVPEAALLHYEESAAGSPAGVLRRLLSNVLQGEGMAGYAPEWWHWSWGDQNWASAYEREYAVYGECLI